MTFVNKEDARKDGYIIVGVRQLTPIARGMLGKQDIAVYTENEYFVIHFPITTIVENNSHDKPEREQYNTTVYTYNDVHYVYMRGMLDVFM